MPFEVGGGGDSPVGGGGPNVLYEADSLIDTDFLAIADIPEVRAFELQVRMKGNALTPFAPVQLSFVDESERFTYGKWFSRGNVNTSQYASIGTGFTLCQSGPDRVAEFTLRCLDNRPDDFPKTLSIHGSYHLYPPNTGGLFYEFYDTVSWRPQYGEVPAITRIKLYGAANVIPNPTSIRLVEI